MWAVWLKEVYDFFSLQNFIIAWPGLTRSPFWLDPVSHWLGHLCYGKYPLWSSWMQDTKNITTAQRQEEENQIEPERERVLSREESLSKEWWFSLSRGDQNTVTGIAVVSLWGLSVWVLRRFSLLTHCTHVFLSKSHISCSVKCILFWFGCFCFVVIGKNPTTYLKMKS